MWESCVWERWADTAGGGGGGGGGADGRAQPKQEHHTKIWGNSKNMLPFCSSEFPNYSSMSFNLMIPGPEEGKPKLSEQNWTKCVIGFKIIQQGGPSQHSSSTASSIRQAQVQVTIRLYINFRCRSLVIMCISQDHHGWRVDWCWNRTQAMTGPQSPTSIGTLPCKIQTTAKISIRININHFHRVWGLFGALPIKTTIRVLVPRSSTDTA